METSKEQIQLIGQIVEEARQLPSREACIIHTFLVYSIPPDSGYMLAQEALWPMLINPKEFPPDDDGSYEVPEEVSEKLRASLNHILVSEIDSLPDWHVTPFFDGTYLIRRGDKLKKPNPRHTINGMSISELRAYLDVRCSP